MKHTIYFPFYHIHSPLVKSALGMKDIRSIERFFRDAEIKIYEIGGKKCVMCEDLLSISKPHIITGIYKGKVRKQIDDLE